MLNAAEELRRIQQSATEEERQTRLRQLQVQLCEDDVRRKLRNARLVSSLERLGERAAVLSAHTNRLRLIKRQYEALVSHLLYEPQSAAPTSSDAQRQQDQASGGLSHAAAPTVSGDLADFDELVTPRRSGEGLDARSRYTLPHHSAAASADALQQKAASVEQRSGQLRARLRQLEPPGGGQDRSWSEYTPSTRGHRLPPDPSGTLETVVSQWDSLERPRLTSTASRWQLLKSTLSRQKQLLSSGTLAISGSEEQLLERALTMDGVGEEEGRVARRQLMLQVFEREAEHRRVQTGPPERRTSVPSDTASGSGPSADETEDRGRRRRYRSGPASRLLPSDPPDPQTDASEVEGTAGPPATDFPMEDPGKDVQIRETTKKVVQKRENEWAQEWDWAARERKRNAERAARRWRDGSRQAGGSSSSSAAAEEQQSAAPTAPVEPSQQQTAVGGETWLGEESTRAPVQSGGGATGPSAETRPADKPDRPGGTPAHPQSDPTDSTAEPGQVPSRTERPRRAASRQTSRESAKSQQPGARDTKDNGRSRPGAKDTLDSTRSQPAAKDIGLFQEDAAPASRPESSAAVKQQRSTVRPQSSSSSSSSVQPPAPVPALPGSDPTQPPLKLRLDSESESYHLSNDLGGDDTDSDFWQ